MKRYLRVSTVAKMMDCSRKAIYNLIYAGKISYIRYSEKNIRIPEDELLEFINKNTKREYYREPYSNYNSTK